MERSRLLSSPAPSLPESVASDIKATPTVSVVVRCGAQWLALTVMHCSFKAASADKLSEVEGNIAVLRDCHEARQSQLFNSFVRSLQQG
eukprot:650452-Amphidinium_carterae.3